MLTVTTETIEGRRIVKVLGLVEGNTVRARDAARDVINNFKKDSRGEKSQIILSCCPKPVKRPWDVW